MEVAGVYDAPWQVIFPGGIVLGYSLPYRINMQTGEDEKYVVLLRDWAFDGIIDDVEIHAINLN